jgi:ComF family protein
MDMPRTNYHKWPEHPVERLFREQIPLVRATSFFYYEKGGRFNELIFQLKYKNNPKVGEVIGRHMAGEMLPSGFFEGIDMLIPVPLHPNKLKRRGYNQCEWIAQGISHVTGIPVITSHLERTKDTDTQTRKSASARWENVEGIFSLQDPSFFSGKHILIIDDVLTTGATILACASAFCDVENIRISIFTLAVAH